MSSTPEAKTRLFRSLFRGREDVYARRYVSAKSGKCGYSPVCAVEWTRGICDKKRVVCAVCPNRRLLPLDDETIRKHLVGHDTKNRDFTIGSYPLLPDDTVRFSAIDLDKASWRSDSASICEMLKDFGLPIARERSALPFGGRDAKTTVGDRRNNVSAVNYAPSNLTHNPLLLCASV